MGKRTQMIHHYSDKMELTPLYNRRIRKEAICFAAPTQHRATISFGVSSIRCGQ